MIGGKGALGAKDFPFGVSLVTLVIPIFMGTPTLDNDQIPYYLIFMGMMIGSFLVITNIPAKIMHFTYSAVCKKNVLKEIQEDKFVNAITEKSFCDAMKTPSISYEEDKIIGMIYFCIILSLSLYHSIFGTYFQNMLNNDSNLITIVGVIVVVSLVGVVIALIWNIWKSSPNHLQKISCVTASLVFSNMLNLMREEKRFKDKIRHDNLILPKVITEINPTEKISDLKELERRLPNSQTYQVYLGDLARSRPQELINLRKQNLPEDEIKKRWKNYNEGLEMSQTRRRKHIFDYYQCLKGYEKLYDITIPDMNTGLYNRMYDIERQEDLWTFLPSLQSEINNRDWQLAQILYMRIMNYVKDIFHRN